jgi:hypothetical protein
MEDLAPKVLNIEAVLNRETIVHNVVELSECVLFYFVFLTDLDVH